MHSNITLEGQQIATELLTAAGANYFMDVGLNTDRMLAYFDTSGHDDQTLREVHGRLPAPEYLAWAVERGIFMRDGRGNVSRGPKWGDASAILRIGSRIRGFVSPGTPALYGFEHAGPRPADLVMRRDAHESRGWPRSHSCGTAH